MRAHGSGPILLVLLVQGGEFAQRMRVAKGIAASVVKIRRPPVMRGGSVKTGKDACVVDAAFPDGSRLPSQVLADAQKEIAKLEPPSGVKIAYGGEQEIGKSFTELLLILGLTVVANLLIVVWEFNSFRAALTILAAIPFSLTGAIFGLG